MNIIIPIYIVITLVVNFVWWIAADGSHERRGAKGKIP